MPPVSCHGNRLGRIGCVTENARRPSTTPALRQASLAPGTDLRPPLWHDCEDNAPLAASKGQKGAVMKKVKRCTHCGGRLGLGVISQYGKLYCGSRCKRAHRAAILEKAKRQKAVVSLFSLLLRANYSSRFCRFKTGRLRRRAFHFSEMGRP